MLYFTLTSFVIFVTRKGNFSLRRLVTCVIIFIIILRLYFFFQLEIYYCVAHPGRLRWTECATVAPCNKQRAVYPDGAMCTSQQPLNTHVALHSILPLRKLLPSRPSLHPSPPSHRPTSSHLPPRPSSHPFLYPGGPSPCPPAHPSILQVRFILPFAWSRRELSRELPFCECHAFLTRFSFRFFTKYLEWKVGSVYLQAEARLQMASKLYYRRRHSRRGSARAARVS